MKSRAFLFSVILVAIAGCGGEDGPVAYPVKGMVTFQGKPVTQGSILFTSTNPELPGANGRLGADGSYQLTTREQGDGAAAGEYKVIIRAFDGPEQPSDTSSAPPRPLVPLKYTKPGSTPLTKTVKKQELNRIDFEL